MTRASRYIKGDLKNILRSLRKHFPENRIERHTQGIPFLLQNEWYSLGHQFEVILDPGDPFEKDEPRLTVKKYEDKIPDSKIEEILDKALPNVRRTFFFDYDKEVSRWKYEYHNSIPRKLLNKLTVFTIRRYMGDRIDPDLL